MRNLSILYPNVKSEEYENPEINCFLSSMLDHR